MSKTNRSRHKLEKNAPAGFSLLEVIVATALLALSGYLLFDLATVGRHHAKSIDRQSTAQLACQSRMNEILTGIRPVKEVRAEDLPEMPGWAWSVELDSIRDYPDILEITVTIREATEEEKQEQQIDEEANDRAWSFSLVRWVRDPQLASEQENDGAQDNKDMQDDSEPEEPQDDKPTEESS
jgi:prepilin-type N-terminal cleavage/methylation domain-containing protein